LRRLRKICTRHFSKQLFRKLISQDIEKDKDRLKSMEKDLFLANSKSARFFLQNQSIGDSSSEEED